MIGERRREKICYERKERRGDEKRCDQMRYNVT
jgi:hypothetical protein